MTRNGANVISEINHLSSSDTVHGLEFYSAYWIEQGKLEECSQMGMNLNHEH